jgi:hypothetical protein
VPRNPLVAKTVKVEFLWSQAGVPAANVLHALYTGGPPSSSDLAAIANLIAAAFWVDPIIADYPTSTTFVGVRLTDLDSDTGADGEHAVGAPGDAGDGPLSAQACLMVNLVIARRYRGGHPRVYFPPPALGVLASPGTWSSAVISDFNGAMTLLNAAFNDAGSGGTTLAGWVCPSFKTGNAWRVTNLVEPVTGWSVNGAVKTQRRRLTASSY